MPSAVWEVVGLDCLMLHKDFAPDSGWRVRTLWLGDPLSLQIAELLKDQIFATKREALQAIEAAQLSIQSAGDAG